MLITIAIPTFNNINTIERTIESCMEQDYQEEYEILIVDNCCTDGSEVLFEKLRKKYELFRIVRNNETVPLFSNHNICLQYARGQYVVFCHSDDVLERKALTILSKKIISRGYPDKYVLWGSSLFRDFYGNFAQAQINLSQILSGERAYSAFFYGGLTPSGTCYSRDIFLKYGGFIEFDHKLAPSDMVTMLLMANKGFEFEMIDRILFCRKDASTARRSTTWSEHCDAFTVAINGLIDKVGIDEFLEMSRHSLRLKNMPLLYFIALIRLGYLKKNILRKMLKPQNIFKGFSHGVYRELLKAVL